MNMKAILFFKKSYLLPLQARLEELQLVTGYRFKVTPGHRAGLGVFCFPELDSDKVLDKAMWSCLCQCARYTWTWLSVPVSDPGGARPLRLREDLFLKGSHLATHDLEFSPLPTWSNLWQAPK